MSTLAGVDEITKMLGDFSFSDFRIIRELHFYHSEAVQQEQNVELVIETEVSNPNVQVRIRFGDVRKLRIDGLGGGENRIVGFDIKDIGAHQLEGIVWQVLDYEDDSFELLSRTAEVVSVTKIGHKPEQVKDPAGKTAN